MSMTVAAFATPFEPKETASSLSVRATEIRARAKKHDCSEKAAIRVECEQMLAALRAQADRYQTVSSILSSASGTCSTSAGAFVSAYARTASPNPLEAGDIVALNQSQVEFDRQCLTAIETATYPAAEFTGMLSADGASTPHCGAVLLQDVIVTAAHCVFDPSGGGSRRFNTLTVTPLGAQSAFNVDVPITSSTERLPVSQDYIALQYPAHIRPPQAQILRTKSFEGTIRLVGQFNTAWPIDLHDRSTRPNLRSPINNQCHAVASTEHCLSLVCQTTAGFSGSPVFTQSNNRLRLLGLISHSQTSDYSVPGCNDVVVRNMTYAVILPIQLPR